MKNIGKFILISSFILLILNSMALADDWDLQGIDIISREEWGADESIRYTSYPKRQSVILSREKQSIELENLRALDYPAYLKKIAQNDLANEKKDTANSHLKENFYDDYTIDYSLSESSGQPIMWAQDYKINKTKIIIHHTSSDNTTIKNKGDAVTYLNNVYKYHTLDNARGDIGYNFIIDPFGNIYEGRAGGEGVVGAHAKRNNTPSIGIALIGNFEEVEPTKEAIDSLINLSAALVKKYNINPFGATYYHKDSNESPYIKNVKGYSIAGHKDAGDTTCPGKNLYNILPYIRSGVYNIVNGKKWESSSNIGLKSHEENIGLGNNTGTNVGQKNALNKSSTKLTYSYFESIEGKIAPAVKQIKNDYIETNNIKFSRTLGEKIVGKISLESARNYLNQDINVLLYDLSENYDSYTLTCNGGCTFRFDDKSIDSASGNIVIGDDIEIELNNKKYTTDKVTVSSQDNIITISNYDRKSYAGVPRNTFHGMLTFKKDYMKDKNGKQKFKYLVINQVSFDDYMKGIVETNDTETDTKNEVMALISKSYALFYMDPKNIHPNIPVGASYNAVDDSDIFQKYVGAGLEKTLTKRYKALAKTKNKIVLYGGYVPILPYFSCSAGFTYSAYEKWGWNDTPYLKSKFDLGICTDKKFSGHGVGLSGLGAERRAKNFKRSYSDILKYYYPGISIVDIN